MHIELTELLRCPEPHEENVLVLSTGEMLGRMVRSGILGCPVCHKALPLPDAQTLQALVDLSGPGGYVVLLGVAARYAVGLADLMGGVHFVGVNAPPAVEELPVLSLLRCARMIPLRQAMARSVVVGADATAAPWLAEAQRVLLRGRRLVVEAENLAEPPGITRLAAAQGLFVGERR